MTASVVKQIVDLEQMSIADLRQRWAQLVGTDPPRYNREFLVRRLAHRLQELTHGGLSQVARDGMDRLLEEAGYDGIGAASGHRQSSRGQCLRPVPGTRLIREWHGERHEVTVVQGGFEHRGQRYRSLTAVATAITGTHWNGPLFFGLREKPQEEKQ